MSNLSMITPECKSKYLWLYKPNEKFGETYSVTCIIDDSPQWEKLIANMKNMLEEFYIQQCTLVRKKALKRCVYFPWKQDTDSGERTFTVKNKAQGMKKDGTIFEIKPKIYGPDKEILKESDLKGSLGNGTLLRCGFTANCWFTDAQGVGISARLNFAQIITPVYFNSTTNFVDPDGEGLKTYSRNNDLFNNSKSTLGEDFDLFDLAEKMEKEKRESFI